MPVAVTLDQILRLAPNARSSYRDAFSAGQSVLDLFEISANPLRVAHFIAQVMHESGALTLQFESLNYSPEGLVKTWPSRFQPKGPLDPSEFAHNQQKIGDAVYGGRMGNDAPGDGFKYRGRGLLQITGKDGYTEMSRNLQAKFPNAPDLVADPDAAISSDWCLKIAAAEWFQKGCNALADQDSVSKVTRAINGGQIGLAERMEWTRRTKAVWPQAAAMPA